MLLPFLATIWRLTLRLLHGKLQVETIDMNDVIKFQTIASLTMNLSKDIYSDTIEKAKNDDNFSIFSNQPQYAERGKIIANFSANATSFMPKILIWEWKGNETAKIPGARIIALRGTQSYEEWVGNFDCEEVQGSDIGINIQGYFHNNFGAIGKKIWDNYKKYIINSHLPVIITGHSRGAGIAEVLYVIAKKETQDTFLPVPIYCMAHAPPPSMSLHEPNSEELTKDVYGFINGDDVVPRMFVGNIIDIFNYYHKYSSIYPFCNIFYSKEQCSEASTQSISYFVSLITSVFPNVQKSIIANATFTMKDKIFSILKHFQYKSDKVIINKQVGNVFHLDWKQLSTKSEKIYGCISKPLMESKLSDPRNLSEIGFKVWKYKNLVAHHDPNYYHHAYLDPVCS